MNLKKIKDAFNWSRTIMYDNMNDWANLMSDIKATDEESNKLREYLEENHIEGKIKCKLSTTQAEGSQPVGNKFIQFTQI